MIKLIFKVALLLLWIFISSNASAGHLFTQAVANTPINLSAGNGIQLTQLTYEGGSNDGSVLVYFNQGSLADPNIAWDAGDAIKITIGAWNQTFTYDGMVAAGGTQSSTQFSITSSSLIAANITPGHLQTTWTVIATAGRFTFEGYRITVNGDKYNGTGADTITQSQVVSASGLGGGGFASVALPNEKGVGTTLDGLSGATGQLGAVVTALNAMTDDSKQLAMKLISPDRSQVMGQSATNTITVGLDTVQVRLNAIRLGVGVGSNFSTSFDKHNHHTQQASNSHKGASGLASGDEALNRDFWVKAFGGKADQDGKHGYAGSDSDMYGIMAGLDRLTETGWLLGAAIAYAKTNVDMTDYRNGDDADIKTYQLTGYFAKSYDRWYMQGMLTYAYQDYETRRNTHLTGIAKGDFNGDLYGVRIVAGMPFTLREDITLTPSLGIEALRINQDDYTEKGAGVLSLRVGDSDVSRIRSLVGLELAKTKLLSDGSKLRPSLQGNWRHEFNDDGMDTTSSFIGGGSEFESIGQNVNRDVFGLSARLNWEKTERIAVSVEVGAEKGGGYTGFNGQIMGKYRF